MYDLQPYVWPFLMYDLQPYVWPFLMYDLQPYVWPFLVYDLQPYVWATRRVPLEGKELFTASEHSSPSPFLCGVRGLEVMVINVTFNTISVISWRSVLLMEKTGDLPQVTNKLRHIMLYGIQLAMSRIRTQNVNCDMHWQHR
jgi:hypothetical protein